MSFFVFQVKIYSGVFKEGENMSLFIDRFDAAEKLVPLLQKYQAQPNTIVLAIPRGGLELGNVLAKRLHLPLDVIFTKKIGLPYNPEYAIGAASDAHVFVNKEFAYMPELQTYIQQEVASIRKVIRERTETYRHNLPPFVIKDKTVIVVDDGVATGSTLLATLALIKEYQPQKIVVALPVAPKHTLEKITHEADEVVCYATPEPFYSVGQFYQRFEQVDDEHAIKLLEEANQ